jgi:phosphohistidine phosphatase
LKTLILVRHAESDRKDDPSIADFDRPLSPVGEQDAPGMAGQLAASDVRVDTLISSPAVRARSTAEAFSQALNLPVQTDGRIYDAGVRKILSVVRDIDDRHSTAVLVGHNPGVSEFLRYLTEENYADLPTVAVAIVELPLRSWRHTFEGKGTLKSCHTPVAESFGLRSGAPELGWQHRYRIWRIEHARKIFLTTVFALTLLLILGIVAVVMHLGTNSSAMPQQGSR